MGAGFLIASTLGSDTAETARAPASTRAVIIDAANQAFVAGPSRGSLVCAGVVALGAVFAFLVLPRRLPGTPPSPPAAPGSKPGQTSSAKLSGP